MEGHNRQQRHRKLGYDEDALDGSEFVIEREIVYHQVGQCLEVASPGEEYRDDGHDDESPFHRTFDDEAAE